MKKIAKFFRDMWDDTDVSDEIYKQYFDYKRAHPDKELFPLMSGRSLIIFLISMVLFISIILIF